MKIESHVVDKDYTCTRCGLDFQSLPQLSEEDFKDIVVGHRIGVITGLSTGPSLYLIRRPDNDSNKLCEEPHFFNAELPKGEA